jgi:hypothetical protein
MEFSLGSKVSASDMQTKLAPQNVSNTLNEANDALNKVSEAGNKAISGALNERKKQYYIDTYNGDPSGNPPYPRMDILDVFSSYVTHTTPDDLKEIPKGSAMDISQVILGIQPTFKMLPDAEKKEADQKMSTRFVGYIVRATDLATAKNVVAHLQENVKTAQAPSQSPAPVYMTVDNILALKTELEIFRLPMMEAMLAFDNPKLFASLKASSPAPAPAPAKEGFSFKRDDPSSWTTTILYGLGTALASACLLWVLFYGKRYIKWYRTVETTRKKTRHPR